MKHNRSKIPPLRDLPAREWISWLWLGWFIDSGIQWRLWSAVFRIKCRLLAVENRGAKCLGGVDLYKAPLSRITIGEGVSIISSSKRGNACSLYAKARIRTYTPSSRITIGARTGMNGISLTARSRSITIGENCRIAPNVVIVDSDYHGVLPASLRADNPGFEYDADVEIEDNVWVGMQSIILKGVTIGRNSVIAAGSVVVNDIPANCIAAGVPAKPVKFMEDKCE